VSKICIRQLDVNDMYNSIRTSNARTLCVTYMEEVHTYIGSDVSIVNVCTVAINAEEEGYTYSVSNIHNTYIREVRKYVRSQE
jgi:hypothetical protein